MVTKMLTDGKTFRFTCSMTNFDWCLILNLIGAFRCLMNWIVNPNLSLHYLLVFNLSHV